MVKIYTGHVASKIKASDVYTCAQYCTCVTAGFTVATTSNLWVKVLILVNSSSWSLQKYDYWTYNYILECYFTIMILYDPISCIEEEEQQHSYIMNDQI